MNGTISKIGSVIVTVTVFLFALFLIVGTTYMQCFVCFFLPIGFILMTSGLHSECVPDRKVAGDAGMIFSAVYCTFIMIVYFTQITTISTDNITEGAAQLIDFRRHGLIFNFDILGYGMM
ncbi:MAG: hypothetical protein IKR73_07790, partial [Oscillospiraceae bacterium]|nr:hypothetical protein [Oscillospiraceae bacterium]